MYSITRHFLFKKNINRKIPDTNLTAFQGASGRTSVPRGVWSSPLPAAASAACDAEAGTAPAPTRSRGLTASAMERKCTTESMGKYMGKWWFHGG